MQLLFILWTVICPIFLIIGVGYVVQRHIGFDVKAVTRLIFWVLMPAFLFDNLYNSKLTGTDMLQIIAHFILLFGAMFVITWFGAQWLGYGDRLRRAMTAAVLFYNSGNYGIPVATLAFGGAGMAVQSIVIIMQNLTNFTIGIGLCAGGREGMSRRHTIAAVFKLPMAYTFFIALLWRVCKIPLPEPLGAATHLLGTGLVPVALSTLGAQMASLESHRFDARMAVTLFIRLCIGPLLGFALVRALHIRPELAAPLIVSTSFPTAVNTALLALEFDNEPDFAAAAVFYTTLFSAVTVSIVIYAAKLLYPS